MSKVSWLNSQELAHRGKVVHDIGKHLNHPPIILLLLWGVMISPHWWRTSQSAWPLGPTPSDLWLPYPSRLSSTKLSPGYQITDLEFLHLQKRRHSSSSSSSRQSTGFLLSFEALPCSYLCPSSPFPLSVVTSWERTGNGRQLLLADGQS